MSDIQQVMDAITAMDHKLTGSINEIKQQNNTLIQEFSLIKTKFNVISDNQIQIREELTAVNIQLEMLKQQSMSAEIVINGIPDKFLGKDILIQTLNKIFKIIDCKEINYWDYRSIFLMKNKYNTTGFTPVCVQLCSNAHKNLLMKNQKLKGSILLQQLDSTLPNSDMRRIIIKDRLTSYTSELIKESFKFKNKYKYKYVWFKDSILLKKTDTSKIMTIASKADLERLDAEEKILSTAPGTSQE